MNKPTSEAFEFQKLLHKSHQGSNTAWKILLERIEPAVLSFIRIKMRPKIRSLEQTLDIYQSSLAEAWEKIHQFKGKDERCFKAWIMTIAEHNILDRMKHGKAQKRGGEGDIPLESPIQKNGEEPAMVRDVIRAQEETPSKVSMGKELKEKLESCIQELPEHHREMILLRNYLCLTPEEVSKRLGKTPGWVRKTHFDALKSLRKKMEGDATCWNYIQRR